MGSYATLDTGYQLKLMGLIDDICKDLYNVDYFDYPTLDWFQLNTIAHTMGLFLTDEDFTPGICDIKNYQELAKWLLTSSRKETLEF